MKTTLITQFTIYNMLKKTDVNLKSKYTKSILIVDTFLLYVTK